MKARLGITAAVVGLLGGVPAGPAARASGAALRLAGPADPGALKVALTALSGRAFGGVTLQRASVFDSQSFRVLDAGAPMATLVSGRGTTPALAAGGDPVNTCFAALVPRSGTAQVALTVGTGDWEAEGCTRVAAVGLLPDAGAAHRIAIVYAASAPHGAALEPVVLRWSAADPLAIDGNASKLASTAGATTLAAIRAAVQ